MSALWIPCEDRDEFFCTQHLMHAHDCECPAIEDMDIDPYTDGGPKEQAQ